MTKQNIIITGFEDSEDKSRTRFQTNKGWMSAFKNEGETLITDLKQHVETLISVDASASKQLNKAGEPYVNIRKFYGKSDGDDEEQPKTPVKPEKKETTEPSSYGSNGNTTMYTSYAKDVFIAMLGSPKGTVKFGTEDQEEQIMMNIAIELVKQARDAF